MNALRFEIPLPAIYRAIDHRDSKYNCYIPAEYAVGCWIGDCVACDEDGVIDPERPCAEIVRAEDIGEFVARLDDYN